jgi:hypothetical protein
MYFDGNRVLTYNSLFNVIAGGRRTGKTFWFKKWAIEDFKKNGMQFMYLRRYDTELDELDLFFDDIRFMYPDTELTVKGNSFFIDGELAGTATALTKGIVSKGFPYPKVNKICYDEFLIEDEKHPYLKNEVKKFNELYVTVASIGADHCDVIVFFFGNAISVYNPFFEYWKLTLPYNKKSTRKGEIYFELYTDAEITERQRKSRFASITDENYQDYAFNNKFVLDTKTFVMKKTEKSRYYFTFKYKNDFYGVWIDYNEGKMFVSNNVDYSCRVTYSITITDHSPNTMLIKALSRAPLFKTFIDNYKLGNVYFESVVIKNVVYEVIKMCNS